MTVSVLFMEPTPHLRHNYDTMIKYTHKITMRKDFVLADGTCALVMQCFLGGHRVRLRLDLYARPDEFDQVRQLVRIPKDRPREQRINTVLAKYKSRVEEMFFEARVTGQAISPKEFVEELDTKPALGSFIEFIVRESEKEKGERAESTIKTYNTVVMNLRKFRPDVTFSDITFSFIQEFDRFLKTNKIDDNSRAKYHKIVRKFVLLAIRKRRRIKNPYGANGFIIKEVDVERTWLTIEEVAKLAKLYDDKILSKGLHITLRHFLFQCVTSMRISDLKRLDRSNIEGDMLVLIPEKTKRLRKIVKVPLSKLAKRMIADSDSKTDKLFNPVTDQTANEHLKEIAKAAGIDKDISTHVGRHTFGFLYLQMGGKVEELREILGHSKIETTMVYTHTDYTRKVAGVNKFDEIFKPIKTEGVA
jgi:integrase/recombinase XerD